MVCRARGVGGYGDGVCRREDEDHDGCHHGSMIVTMKTVVVVVA